jgi:SAM-dependent MidA family methyltransferase
MGGDFITAPQISSLFNEMIALFFVYQFKKRFREAGKKVYFIELGAGNGFFIRDFLTIVNKVKDFKNNLEVILIETSDNLINEQKQKVAEFAAEISIKWEKDALLAIDNIPDSGNVFIFANEFFDAFPIDQYVKREGKWNEVCVRNKKEGEGWEFGFSDFDFSRKVEEYLLLLNVESDAVQDGEVVEFSSEAIKIFSQLARKIKKNSGAALIIDYGYLQTQFISTLQSIKNHASNNILENVGEADITHLVNFELLFNVASREGLETFPPITQKEFLTSIGMNEKLELALQK